MRDLASRFLSSEVKSGQETNFWYDTLTPLGLLTSVFGEDGTHRRRTRADAYVANVCNTTGWTLPHLRPEEEVALHTSFFDSCSLTRKGYIQFQLDRRW